MLTIVISASLTAGVLIFYAPSELSEYLENFVVDFPSYAASVLSILLLLKQKTRHGRVPFAFLSAGMILWSIAEFTWTYMVLVMGIEIPYPSVADVFYLSGYFFAGVFLFMLYRISVHEFERKFVVIVAAITIEAFFLNFFLIQLVESIVGFSQLTFDEGILLAVSMIYPLLDGVLLVPAAVLITGFRLGIMSRFSTLMLAVALVLFAVADTGFGYFALTDFSALQDERMWDTFYSISYILFAGCFIRELLEPVQGRSPKLQEVKERKSGSSFGYS